MQTVTAYNSASLRFVSSGGDNNVVLNVVLLALCVLDYFIYFFLYLFTFFLPFSLFFGASVASRAHSIFFSESVSVCDVNGR